MPGTLRSASDSCVAFCERINASGTVLMNCGMSRSGVSVRVALLVASVRNSSRLPSTVICGSFGLSPPLGCACAT